MRLIYETALLHTDLLKLFISVRASISTCSACHLICAPLPCPKRTLLYLVHQCFYPFLWISTLNKSTQLSLKESTAALTHYESFGTRNFRKKREERQRKALHFGSNVHICQRTLGFSWPVSSVWLRHLFNSFMHWERCFLEPKART